MIKLAEKKQIVVKAIKFDDEQKAKSLIDFIKTTGENAELVDTEQNPTIIIHKSIGEIELPLGNWLIHEENADEKCWSIDHDIFLNTYEPTNEIDKYVKTKIFNQFVRFDRLDRELIYEILLFAHPQSFVVEEVSQLQQIVDNAIKNQQISVLTLEGTEILNFGDYLVKGVANEVYPVKAINFDRVYKETKLH